MNPTDANPRLTTRRVDGFTSHELQLLRLAEDDFDGILWLISGKIPSDYFQAAYSLQRLGYFWPTEQRKPETSGSFGWKLTDEGRAALAIVNRRIAA